jgi:hypothetical protein
VIEKVGRWYRNDRRKCFGVAGEKAILVEGTREIENTVCGSDGDVMVMRIDGENVEDSEP